MKAIRFLAVLLAAALLLSGCNLIAVNPERDGKQIVAVVGGENITKKQVFDYAGLTLGAKVEAWNVDSVNEQKQSALQNMIASKVVLQKAKEQKMYDFTDAEKKQVEDYLSSYIQSTYDDALKKYQEKAKTDKSINPEELANKDVDSFLTSQGLTRDKIRQSESDNIAYDKLKDSVTKSITVTDTDVKTAYDSAVSSQKSAFDSDPKSVVTADGQGEQILYYPADGFVRVKHILIPLPDDVQTKINNLRSEKKDSEADSTRTEALKSIEATAKEALAKAKAPGADLDQLIKEYGKDPGMESKPEGYLVYKDNTDAYAAGFAEAALALPGLNTPSDLVATDYGYHIIWQVEKEAKGAVPYDKIKDKYKETVLSQKKDDTWQTKVQTWMTDGSVKIKEYTGRLD